MYQEEIIEEGIVITSSNKFAEVVITRNDNCEHCSAKIICSPKDTNLRTLKVIDNFHTQPGDIVKISIQGNTILKVSALIYALPLLILIAGIMLSFYLFDFGNNEIYSFLCGLGCVMIYYFILFLINKYKPSKIYPRIISVKQTS
ncbi:SoxR reducing system RseC family protein [Ignavibacteria bacterium 4148-Me]|uniref:SoxR reducing system RseC family protein n=1 Tax=Rosettibacter primus TaxID=3111523 RepID=UPI00336C230D